MILDWMLVTDHGGARSRPVLCHRLVTGFNRFAVTLLA